MEQQRFAGRVVMVTGATGGLGQAVVAALVAEGARVAAVGRRAEAVAALRPAGDLGEALLPVQADLAQEPQAQQAVQQALTWGQRIDALVHTIGGYAGGQPAAAGPLEAWHQMLDVNLWTAIHILRAILPPMVSNGGGHIVTVSSRAAQRIGRNVAAYTVGKAGLEALTLSVAEEYRAYGITANAVAPSAIATPAMLAHASDAERARWVSPASLARVILFLASDEAADVSGAVVPVYGRA